MATKHQDNLEEFSAAVALAVAAVCPEPQEWLEDTNFTLGEL